MAGGGKRIGTHSGKFHADEALACAMLRMTHEFSGAEIVRTRDEAVLADMDVVVDVGGVYDAARHRYDHHQPSFTDTYSAAHKTLLSSAGLVYKHFGDTILRERFNVADATVRATVLRRVYDRFIEPFDGVDNGVPRYAPDVPAAYAAPFALGDHIAMLNPAWNAPSGEKDADARFAEAVRLASDAFSLALERTAHVWMPARAIVASSLACTEVFVDGVAKHVDPRILVLQDYCPWQEHLHDLEAENIRTEPVLYAIFGDAAANSWRVQAVSVAPDRFENRRSLPSAWRGLRDAELDAVTGVPGGIFVHRSGFIGGHSTLAGAIALAERALE